MSDHDIVFTDLDMRPVKQSKKEGKDQESIQSSTTPDPGYQWKSEKPRRIPINRKAEWEPMKKDMKSLHKDMEAMYNSKTTGVNGMWEKFRDTLQHSINSHIPRRQLRSKDGYPWIGPELKKMMKRQHRYYKKFSNAYPMPKTEDQFPVIEDIDITLNRVVKLLNDLYPTK